MRPYLFYLKYLIRHKWFVFCACLKRGLVWQGIVHDWTKFLPSEFIPYARFFYGNPADGDRQRFDAAWLKHQHRSPHHWQHWVLRNDDGSTVLLQMPQRYVLEMLADWDGAGRAITGSKTGTPAWYAKNRQKINLHPETRAFVDHVLKFDQIKPA